MGDREQESRNKNTGNGYGEAEAGADFFQALTVASTSLSVTVVSVTPPRFNLHLAFFLSRHTEYTIHSEFKGLMTEL